MPRAIEAELYAQYEQRNFSYIALNPNTGSRVKFLRRDLTSNKQHEVQ
jgi:hypothetical protein